jgi:hypothetical protein
MKKIGDFVDLEMHDKYLIARYKAGPKIDLSAAKIILNERLEFTNYKSVPVLVIDSGLVSMDKQARDFLSSDEAIKGIRASAIISSSVVNSMLVNFILKISRPNLPVKVFTDLTAAENWLNSFVDEEKSDG